MLPSQNGELAALLSLSGLGKLALSPLLGRLSASLSVKDKVPPSEATGVVSNELLMVNIVVLGASPEGQEMVETPWELVTAVRINGLEDTEDDPNIHCQDVEILGDSAPQDWDTDATETEDHDLNGRGVLGSQTERSRVLVVDFVDVLVEEGASMHQAMRPVVPCILEHEEDGYLVGYGDGAGEWNGGLETEVLAHRVEEPDLREFDSKVGEEDKRGALCLFPGGGNFVLLNLVLPEVWDAVDDDPG